jgi:uncharacterized RDD family membrane protein YckC
MCRAPGAAARAGGILLQYGPRPALPLPSPVDERLPAAPLWRRLCAFGYDLLALIGIWVFITIIAVALNHGPVGAAIVDGEVRVQNWWAQAALYAGLWVATGFYYALSWRYGGQTLGMRPWRLQLERAGAGTIGFGLAWLRYLYATLGLLLAGTGMLYCLVDRDRRALHDTLVDTRMAVLPKRSS